MNTEASGLIGRSLGDFIVRERIGAGGFGAVYRAEQPKLGREAVIKVPLIQQGASQEYVARFLREARLASMLDHPYAAHIYAFGSEPDGTLWTAMELVRGMTLGTLLFQQGPLPLERFVPLFEKLCEVVHTAHEQGIIHRDLKPANVMVLTRAGQLLPKLLDLGIAKGDDRMPAIAGRAPSSAEGEPTPQLELLTDEKLQGQALLQTREGKRLGSPAYMAPEQWIDARRADARTDVYALGILAFETLTGKLPFPAETLPMIAMAHAMREPPPLGGELPVALDAVIAKAMAKKPADRYATALEMSAAMRKAAGYDHEQVELPQLDRKLHDELLATAPQPLAEAVAALDGVRNAHQAQGAVFQIARVIARLIGNLALAAWAQTGATAAATSGPIAMALRRLRQHGLSDLEWLELAREITGQFVARREAFALPELIAWGHGALDTAQGAAPSAETLAALLTMKARFEESLAMDEDALGVQLAQTLPLLERCLRELAWLAAYAMVVPKGDFAERWMGVRRPQRSLVLVRAREPLPPAQLILLDADGAPVLPLWPLVQVAEPSPGQAAELFVLDGGGRDGARLLSLPTGFERSDAGAWPWLQAHVGIAADDETRRTAERAPYRGLAAFTPEEADMFVGREREAEAFANRLRVTSLLAVAGPSGAGKSSFIQAGVMPSLGAGWTSLIVRPGGSPMLALRATLTASPLNVLGTEVDVEGDGLRKTLRAWARAHKRAILLYVDQFEELFTLCHDPDERERYVAALVGAAADPSEPVRVVLTVRDDFLVRCQQLQLLRDRLVQGLQLLATPTPDDLERILVEPARRAGYEFEDPTLPGEMVAAIAEMNSALPLLSFTALQLWDLRDRAAHQLTRTAYASLGGVGGALAQHAERVLAAMSPEEQALVRIAFRNLVTAEGTRAVLTRDELVQLLGNQAAAESALERLIGARLLAASEGVGGVDRVEVVHEALLSAWPRLMDWRREDAEGARLRDQLRAAARQWHERGRPRGLLWRDEALTEYQLWRVRQPGLLTDVEQHFGDASEREAIRGRRIRNAAIATILTILSVGLVVALVLYRGAEVQRARATTNEAKATANEAKAKELVVSGYVSQGQRAANAGDANQALLYLTAAKQGGATGPTVDIPLATVRGAMNAEQQVYRGHDKKVWALALRDGSSFVSAGSDGTLRAWSRERSRPLATVKDATAGIPTLELSSDGRLLAVPSFDGHVRLYEADTLTLRFDLQQGTAPLTWARFVDGDRQLFAVGEDGAGALWDVATGALRRRLGGTTAVTVPATSRGGRWLAVPGFDRKVRVWDMRGSTDPWVLDAALGAVASVAAFSGDGAVLAVGSWDRSITLWDMATRQRTTTLMGHAASVDTLAWSADGTQLASGSRDGAIKIWGRDGSLQRTLQDMQGYVQCIKWSADGARMLTCAGDAVVLWDVGASLPIARYVGHGAATFDAAFGPSDDEVLTSGGDGTLRRWAISSSIWFAPSVHKAYSRVRVCDRATSWLSIGEDGRAYRRDTRGTVLWQSPPTWEVSDVACATASARQVVGLADGALHVMENLTEPPVPLSTTVKIGTYPILDLSPDGAEVVVEDEPLVIHAIRIADGRARPFVPTSVPAGAALDIAWSPDGAEIMRWSRKGAAVWDAATGKLRVEVNPPDGQLRHAFVDAASNSLLVTTEEFFVRRLSLADGRELTRYPVATYPTAAIVVGDRVVIGLDDGGLVEHELESGVQRNLLGTFSALVAALHPATGGLIWLYTGDRQLRLVDTGTTATLFQTRSPVDLAQARPLGTLGLVFSGYDGNVAVAALARDEASLERLSDEVACRVPLLLSEGAVLPKARDLEACRRIEGARVDGPVAPGPSP